MKLSEGTSDMQNALYLIDIRLYFSDAMHPHINNASAAFSVSFSASGCNEGTVGQDIEPIYRLPEFSDLRTMMLPFFRHPDSFLI